ncbi:MAG: glycosyltransferase 87 family protein [Chloroflexota bacterium]
MKWLIRPSWGGAARTSARWKLLLSLVVASLAMGAGFWLKWRYLLSPDPHGWFLYSWGQMAYTDLVALYLQQDLATHPIPYLQTWLEYPVVVGFVQYLAALAPGPQGYFLAAGVGLAAAGLGSLWILDRITPAARLWVFAATPPLILYASLNWDLLAISFALLGLYLFHERRDGWSSLALSLGVWTKLFPAVLLLWVVVKRAIERDWRGVALLVGVFVAASAALNLPVYLANREGWLYFFEFQGARPPDGGSLWSHAARWGLPVPWINRGSLLLSAAGVVALAIGTLRAGRRAEEFGLGAVVVLILASKITSPQYDLWVMPFLALLPAPLWLIALFATVDLAYFWTSFQTLYLWWGGQSDLAHLHPMVAAAVNAAHQGTLLMILLWMVARMRRKVTDP